LKEFKHKKSYHIVGLIFSIIFFSENIAFSQISLDAFEGVYDLANAANFNKNGGEKDITALLQKSNPQWAYLKSDVDQTYNQVWSWTLPSSDGSLDHLTIKSSGLGFLIVTYTSPSSKTYNKFMSDIKAGGFEKVKDLRPDLNHYLGESYAFIVRKEQPKKNGESGTVYEFNVVDKKKYTMVILKYSLNNPK
jgi:hypothetical protein